MPGQLKKIREAIRARLDGNTAAGPRVTTNRADKVWNTGLPAIVIYTLEQVDELDAQAPPSYKCTAQVAIHLLLQDDDGLPLDDATDDLAEQVSALLRRDPWLGGLAHFARQVRWDLTIREGGEQLTAGGRLTWEFVWFEQADTGDAAELAPWKTSSTDYSLDPSQS